MRVTVKTPEGDAYPLDVKGTDTIAETKKKIEEKTGRSAASQVCVVLCVNVVCVRGGVFGGSVLTCLFCFLVFFFVMFSVVLVLFLCFCFCFSYFVLSF